MNEEFLHYIWQHKLYSPTLKTNLGETIEVINPGTKNTDGGPDFFNAKLKINDTLWAGNVEIHQNENEWYQHHHHTDNAYNNVILHVVKNRNNHTVNAKNRSIPTCIIQYPQHIEDKYQAIINNTQWVACSNVIKRVNEFTLIQWLDRLLIEKLQEKSAVVNDLLKSSKNDWDQVFFVLLARSFGFGVNSLPFEIMARQTPLTVLLKHSNSIFQLEALLFGQAGFLEKTEQLDEYGNRLSKEYTFLKSKYKLKSIEKHLWKFLRLRPSNFPTIRIAQLAGLLHKTKGQFDELHSNNYKSLPKLLNTSASDYWQLHYNFNKASKKSSEKHLGKASVHRIIYNTIIPYKFIYALLHKDKKSREKLIDYLYSQPPEKNRILSSWQNIGINIDNEATAQALIFLKNSYCNHKKCLNCHIGHEILCKT